jgi:nucleoside-diphosphate-sugar epimerase
MKSENILVTGGTGFLGSYIIRHLLSRGYQSIYGLKRSTSRMDLVDSVKDRITWIDGDILNSEALYETLKGKDKIIHCAAMVSFNPKDRDLMIQANQTGTANMVNAALENKVNKFVHISSIAALGRASQVEKINENSEWAESKYNSQYAISKYLSEMEAWRGHIEGLNVVVLNPSVILGSGYWNSGTRSLFSTIRKGLKFYPAGQTGFVDVRDVAKLAGLVLEQDHNGKRFICNGENVHYKRLFEWIADGLFVNPPSIRISSMMSELSWVIFGGISMVTGKDPVVTKETVRAIQCVYEYDNSLSKEVLGFQYTPIIEAVRETCQQFIESEKEKRSFAVLPK